jgi:hypothetical protein
MVACVRQYPNDAPLWEGRVIVNKPPKRVDQVTQSVYLIEQRTEGKTPQIYMCSTLSNKGRHDGKSVATAAAVLYHKKSEWGHTECTLGKKLTQTDIEVKALHPALKLLRDFASETKYTGPVQLITGSPSVLHLFLDFSPHATQHAALSFAWEIDFLLTEHPQLSLTIQYAK